VLRSFVAAVRRTIAGRQCLEISGSVASVRVGCFWSQPTGLPLTQPACRAQRGRAGSQSCSTGQLMGRPRACGRLHLFVPQCPLEPRQEAVGAPGGIIPGLPAATAACAARPPAGGPTAGQPGRRWAPGPICSVSQNGMVSPPAAVFRSLSIDGVASVNLPRSGRAIAWACCHSVTFQW
jgi:hypothetical protein